MEWTIGELAATAAQTVAAAGVSGVDARVTELPDVRTIRWYTTIGLLDRPLAYRGRTALYGERHLLQLVAVKRRQADGRSIAEIQTELAGASDRTLRRIAHPSSARAFWKQPSAAAAPPEPLLTGVPLGNAVVLLLPTSATAADAAAIRAAAGPLLDLLDQRRLTRRSQA